MSEYNHSDNNEQGQDGAYRNNYNSSYSRETLSGYGSRPPRQGRGGGPWLTATLVLVAFLAGAMAVRYIPAFHLGGTAPVETRQNRPTADETQAPLIQTKASASPQATLPAIGGSLSQAGDVPSIAKAVGPAVVGVVNKASGFMWNNGGEQVEQGTGSGVIISADGYVVTNNHVISGADQVSVTLPGGEEVDAKIVGADEQTDLAVLKIEKTGLTAAPIGDSDQMQVGQTVIAIGNPLGEELAGTVTMGILSARDRQLVVDGYKFKLFQTDAAINPGNSGGALVNMAGELIGINSSKSTSAGVDEYGSTISAEGIGFAIPINDAMPIIQQLLENGYIPRPSLGIVSAQEVTKSMSVRYHVPQGIVLWEISPSGALDQAGAQTNDIITEIDGKSTTTLATMNEILSSHSIGDMIEIKISRAGGEHVLNVELKG